MLTQNPSLINGTHWSIMDPKEFSLISVPVESTPLNKNLLSANMLIDRANVRFFLLIHKNMLFFLFFFINNNKNILK